MKVKFLKEIKPCYVEYEALEDGIIVTDSGGHPTFDLPSLEDMKIFSRKGATFQLRKEYVKKNSFEVAEESKG